MAEDLLRGGGLASSKFSARSGFRLAPAGPKDIMTR